MDLMKMLGGYFDDAKIEELANKVGESKETVQKAVEQMLPNIMGSLSSKLSFLDKDGDGDITDDIKSMFGMGDSEPAADAKAVFDDKASEVTAMVSKTSGIAEDKAKTLLDEVTGMATGFLGNMTGGEGGFDMKGMLSQVQSQGAGALDSLNKQFGNILGGLDADGDGSIVDDLQEKGKKLFGGLFGKK
jgi:hypothetical protein